MELVYCALGLVFGYVLCLLVKTRQEKNIIVRVTKTSEDHVCLYMETTMDQAISAQTLIVRGIAEASQYWDFPERERLRKKLKTDIDKIMDGQDTDNRVLHYVEKENPNVSN